MKCNEPKPGDSWRECDLELKHVGAHRYLNESWPRVMPNEPDEDVDVLLSRAARGRYDIAERSFPIIVTETITRVLWVQAENEDDALAYWADDYSDIPLKEAEVIDGDLEFRRLDDVERMTVTRTNRFESKIGPLLACPDCGKESFRRSWFHDPYRKCHGPLVWRKHPGALRPWLERNAAPVHDTAKAVAA